MSALAAGESGIRPGARPRAGEAEHGRPSSSAPNLGASKGKEEDVEVGLVYFGKRYLNPQLGRWVSPDPLAIHGLGRT